jgi:hypothetical protein
MPGEDLTSQEDDSPNSGGRSAHFQGGVNGGGFGAHIASALPKVKQASPDFDPASSVLMAANQYSGVGLGSSDSTMRVSNPYGMSMRNSIKQMDDGNAEE